MGTTMLVVPVAFISGFLQERRVAPPQPAAERRVALLIGNDAYAERPLANAVNDAQALAATLRELGFVATVETDVRKPELDRAVDRFIVSLQPSDVALFYYSGHGFQIDGENYLAPVGFAAIDAADAKYQAYSASRMHDRIAARNVRLAIVILDACRDNPFVAARSAGGGWAAMGAGRGAYVAFATAPGRTASDNRKGRNGLFTANLLEALREPGLGLNDVFDRVRERVAASSGGRQVPWTTSSVIGTFVFRPAALTPASPLTPDPDLARREELALWESIQDSRNPRVFEDYLRQYPSGRFRAAAEDRLTGLRAVDPRVEAFRAICGTRNCFSLRYTSACDAACTEKVAERLRTQLRVPVDVYFSFGQTDQPGCVGFRPDLGSRLEWAELVRDVLSDGYYIGSCAIDGFLIEVRTRPLVPSKAR